MVLLPLEEEGSLRNEVAIRLNHGENVKHVLLFNDNLGTEEGTVAVAKVKELGDVGVGETAAGLVLVLEEGEAGDGEAEQGLELGEPFGAAPVDEEEFGEGLPHDCNKGRVSA